MPISTVAKQKPLHGSRSQALAAKSSLFEIGELSDNIDHERFILRLNTLLASRDANAEKNLPSDLASAILKTGTPDRRSELIFFGMSDVSTCGTDLMI